MNRVIRVTIILCLFILMIAVTIFVYTRVVYPTEFNMQVETSSIKYELEQSLIFAIIKVESNYDQYAISSRGAVGLMQILPSTAKWITDNTQINLGDPNVNIDVGCRYLRYLMDKYNDIIAVLAAYNAGEGNVDKWLNEHNSLDVELMDHIAFDETRRYVQKVLKYKKCYQKIYNL